MDWSALLTALATSVAAGAAVVVIFVSRNQVAIAQKQVTVAQQQMQISQQQASLALETLHDLHRPMVCPSGTLPRTGGDLDWNLKEYGVTFQNVGSGIALNVCAVMMPPKPTTPQYILSPRYTVWRLPHLLPNAPEHQLNMGLGVLSINGDATIDQENQRALYAPSKPSDLDLRVGRGYNIIARLTLTYQDIFGFKHAGIFDYIDLYGWQHVASLAKIQVDLEDLQHQRDTEERRQQESLSRQTLKQITGMQ